MDSSASEVRKPQLMTLGRFYKFCREKDIDFKEEDSE